MNLTDDIVFQSFYRSHNNIVVNSVDPDNNVAKI